MEDERSQNSYADQIVNDLLPEDLDWRQLVVTYPLPVLAVVAAGGFFIGRQHGTAILEALSNFAGREVSRNVASLLGEDVEA